MAESLNQTGSPPSTGSTFWSRLFHYAIGLSIGCVMAGAIMSARHKAAQARAAEEAALREQVPATAATPGAPASEAEAAATEAHDEPGSD